MGLPPRTVHSPHSPAALQPHMACTAHVFLGVVKLALLLRIQCPSPSDPWPGQLNLSGSHAAAKRPSDHLPCHSQGGKEYLMRAHFGLPSVEAEDKEGKPPISVKFEIPYFTTSGIQVRYLKIIEKSGYQALPWVRYITQNGDYQLRTQ